MPTNVGICKGIFQFMNNFVVIGTRLKEERKRLGMSQADFAALGGAGRASQFNYESGERAPDAGYLAGIADAGADVAYIVTGRYGDADIAQGTVVDWDLLEQVIAGIDVFLNERKAKLRADKKAALVRVLYFKLAGEANLNKARFNDFMEAVMTTV